MNKFSYKTVNASLVFFFLVLLLISSNTFAQSLTLSTFAGPPLSNSNQTGLYDLIIKEAFRREGINIKIIQLPAERSLKNANEGITDGDFVRIKGLETIYTNLLRLPEKITDFEFVGFSKNASITITDWESLKPYDIAIVRGWKILETNIIGCRSLVKTKNQDLLFTMLQKNRIDIVIYSRFEGYELIHKLGIDGVHALEPPLEVKEMYLYLNKKHRKIVQSLSNHLKTMKKDGSFNLIKSKVLTPYLKGIDNEQNQ